MILLKLKLIVCDICKGTYVFWWWVSILEFLDVMSYSLVDKYHHQGGT